MNDSEKHGELGELNLIKQMLTEDRHAGNPLLPFMQQIIEMYHKLELQSRKDAHEIKRLRTQLVEMSRSLELASRFDSMTGLANRRDIMEKIEREASRAQRHQRIFSAFLVNVDNFKQINDTYGFNTGDDVLVEIAMVLRGCVRREDVCARWGGEEFLYLLPETGIEGALSVANKVLTSVSMTEFVAQRPGIRTTVSIGIGEYNPASTVYEFISQLDQALATSKRNGKNRYTMIS